MTRHNNTNSGMKPVNTKKLFGFECDWNVDGFQESSEYVPEIDSSYCFDKATTLAILAGFQYNRKVLIHGLHGTGKSSHIEQVAARLNWPCFRVNLDGNISRMDLIGRDAIVIEEGKQVTRFKYGIIPWSIERPMALVLDEYDAARPDVLFILQRLLETESRFTLLDENKVLHPHPQFRLFATANTVGLGDASGLYHGTHPINQGQMDRWHVVTSLHYVSPQKECAIIQAKVPALTKKEITIMVKFANLIREAFEQDEISTVMSPRTVISWAENTVIFQDRDEAFKLTFYHKSDLIDKPLIAELYQRCFNVELDTSVVAAIAF